MDSFEWNKVFAAVLVAGIVASASGFIASQLVHPEKVTAHGPEAEGAGPAAAEGSAGPEPILHLLAAADVERGQKLFRACASCHSVQQGGPHGVGPNLWNMLSRGVENAPGLAYSGALSQAAGESWEYTELNRFIWKPKGFAPATKMVYIGMKKPEDRAALIAYLRTLSDSPPALPGEADIAAEAAELAPPEPEGEAEAGEETDGAAGGEAERPSAVPGGGGAIIEGEETGETTTVEEPEDLEEAVPPATDEGAD